LPALAVNPDITRSNHLYVLTPTCYNTSDRADVFFLQSTNGGVAWTAPLRINQDTTANDQWMPALAVGPDGNKLSWLVGPAKRYEQLPDRRLRSLANIATNGTVTLFPNDFRITTESFPAIFAGSRNLRYENGQWKNDPSAVWGQPGYYDPVWPPYDVALDWWYRRGGLSIHG